MTIPKTIRNFLIVLGIVIGILPIPVYRYVSLHGNIIFPLRFLALIHQDTSYFLLWIAECMLLGWLTNSYCRLESRPIKFSARFVCHSSSLTLTSPIFGPPL